jgi:hypothetical protein
MKNSLKKGTRFHIEGDSCELGITGYDCRVDTDGTVAVSPYKGQKKILATLEEIDHDRNVNVLVYVNKLKITQ